MIDPIFFGKPKFTAEQIEKAQRVKKSLEQGQGAQSQDPDSGFIPTPKSVVEKTLGKQVDIPTTPIPAPTDNNNTDIPPVKVATTDGSATIPPVKTDVSEAKVEELPKGIFELKSYDPQGFEKIVADNEKTWDEGDKWGWIGNMLSAEYQDVNGKLEKETDSNKQNELKTALNDIIENANVIRNYTQNPDPYTQEGISKFVNDYHEAYKNQLSATRERFEKNNETKKVLWGMTSLPKEQREAIWNENNKTLDGAILTTNDFINQQQEALDKTTDENARQTYQKNIDAYKNIANVLIDAKTDPTPYKTEDLNGMIGDIYDTDKKLKLAQAEQQKAQAQKQPIIGQPAKRTQPRKVVPKKPVGAPRHYSKAQIDNLKKTDKYKAAEAILSNEQATLTDTLYRDRAKMSKKEIADTNKQINALSHARQNVQYESDNRGILAKAGEYADGILKAYLVQSDGSATTGKITTQVDNKKRYKKIDNIDVPYYKLTPYGKKNVEKRAKEIVGEIEQKNIAKIKYNKIQSRLKDAVRKGKIEKEILDKYSQKFKTNPTSVGEKFSEILTGTTAKRIALQVSLEVDAQANEYRKTDEYKRKYADRYKAAYEKEERAELLRSQNLYADKVKKDRHEKTPSFLSSLIKQESGADFDFTKDEKGRTYDFIEGQVLHSDSLIKDVPGEEASNLRLAKQDGTLQATDGTLNNLLESERILQEAHEHQTGKYNNYINNFRRGLVARLFSPGVVSLGLSDIRDTVRSNFLADTYDTNYKEAIKKGLKEEEASTYAIDNLSEEQKSDILARMMFEDIQSKYYDKMSTGYRGGQVTAEMLPFAVSLGVGEAIAQSAIKGIGKFVAKKEASKLITAKFTGEALKRATKLSKLLVKGDKIPAKAWEKVSSRVLEASTKRFGKVGKYMAKGMLQFAKAQPGLAVTTAIGPMTHKSLGDVYFASKVYEHRDPTFAEQRDSIVSSYIENLTERVGGDFLGRGLKHIPFLKRFWNSDLGLKVKNIGAGKLSIFKPISKTLKERMFIGGFGEEYMEEVNGAILNSIYGSIVGNEEMKNQFKEFWTKDNQAVLVASLSSLLLPIPFAVGGGFIRNHQYSTARRNFVDLMNKNGFNGTDLVQAIEGTVLDGTFKEKGKGLVDNAGSILLSDIKAKVTPEEFEKIYQSFGDYSSKITGLATQVSNLSKEIQLMTPEQRREFAGKIVTSMEQTMDALTKYYGIRNGGYVEMTFPGKTEKQKAIAVVYDEKGNVTGTARTENDNIIITDNKGKESSVTGQQFAEMKVTFTPISKVFEELSAQSTGNTELQESLRKLSTITDFIHKDKYGQPIVKVTKTNTGSVAIVKGVNTETHTAEVLDSSDGFTKGKNVPLSEITHEVIDLNLDEFRGAQSAGTLDYVISSAKDRADTLKILEKEHNENAHRTHINTLRADFMGYKVKLTEEQKKNAVSRVNFTEGEDNKNKAVLVKEEGGTYSVYLPTGRYLEFTYMSYDRNGDLETTEDIFKNVYGFKDGRLISIVQPENEVYINFDKDGNIEDVFGEGVNEENRNSIEEGVRDIPQTVADIFAPMTEEDEEQVRDIIAEREKEWQEQQAKEKPKEETNNKPENATDNNNTFDFKGKEEVKETPKKETKSEPKSEEKRKSWSYSVPLDGRYSDSEEFNLISPENALPKQEGDWEAHKIYFANEEGDEYLIVGKAYYDSAENDFEFIQIRKTPIDGVKYIAKQNGIEFSLDEKGEILGIRNNDFEIEISINHSTDNIDYRILRNDSREEEDEIIRKAFSIFAELDENIYKLEQESVLYSGFFMREPGDVIFKDRNSTKEDSNEDEDEEDYETEDSENEGEETEEKEGNEVEETETKKETSDNGNPFDFMIDMVNKEAPKDEGLAIIWRRFKDSTRRMGAKAAKMTTDNRKLTGRYILVESGGITPSHNSKNHFRQSEGYPVTSSGTTINDRDYSKSEHSQLSVIKKAAHYNGLAVDDCPIVDGNGIVLSGNDRTMAGEIAAQNGTDGEYLSYLRENIELFGLTKGDFDSMKHPRLVFVLDKTMPYTTQTFALFNTSNMKSQTMAEKAVKYGKMIVDLGKEGAKLFKHIASIIDQFDTLDLCFADKMAVNSILNYLKDLNIIRKEDFVELVKTQGSGLNITGKEVLKNILISGFIDEEALDIVNNNPFMMERLVKALAELSENYLLTKEYTLIPFLSKAIKLLANARNHKFAKLGDSMYTEVGSPLLFRDKEAVDAAIQILANTLNDKKVTAFKRILESYNKPVRDVISGQMNIWGIESRNELLYKIIKEEIKNHAISAKTKEIYGPIDNTVQGNGDSKTNGRTTSNTETSRENSGRTSEQESGTEVKGRSKEGVETKPKTEEVAGEKSALPTETKEEPGDTHKLFTKKAKDEAVAKLRAKFNNLNMGFDPEVGMLTLQVGGYYIEEGVLKFGAWAKKMIAELGTECKKHLKGTYKNLRSYEEFDKSVRDEMDPDSYVDDFDLDAIDKEEENNDKEEASQPKKEGLFADLEVFTIPKPDLSKILFKDYAVKIMAVDNTATSLLKIIHFEGVKIQLEYGLYSLRLSKIVIATKNGFLQFKIKEDGSIGEINKDRRIGDEEAQGWIDTMHEYLAEFEKSDIVPKDILGDSRGVAKELFDAIEIRDSFVALLKKMGIKVDMSNDFDQTAYGMYQYKTNTIFLRPANRGSVPPSDREQLGWIVRLANTSIHEYTHFWTALIARQNPTLWKRGIELLDSEEGKRLTKEIRKTIEKNGSRKYSIGYDTRSKQMYYSEILARLVAEYATEKLTEVTDKKFLHALKVWVRGFWDAVKKIVLGKRYDELTIGEFVRMPIVDLLQGLKKDKFGNHLSNFADQDAEKRMDLTELLQKNELDIDFKDLKLGDVVFKETGDYNVEYGGGKDGYSATITSKDKAEPIGLVNYDSKGNIGYILLFSNYNNYAIFYTERGDLVKIAKGNGDSIENYMFYAGKFDAKTRANLNEIKIAYTDYSEKEIAEAEVMYQKGMRLLNDLLDGDLIDNIAKSGSEKIKDFINNKKISNDDRNTTTNMESSGEDSGETQPNTPSASSDGGESEQSGGHSKGETDRNDREKDETVEGGEPSNVGGSDDSNGSSVGKQGNRPLSDDTSTDDGISSGSDKSERGGKNREHGDDDGHRVGKDGGGNIDGDSSGSQKTKRFGIKHVSKGKNTEEINDTLDELDDLLGDLSDGNNQYEIENITNPDNLSPFNAPKNKEKREQIKKVTTKYGFLRIHSGEVLTYNSFYKDLINRTENAFKKINIYPEELDDFIEECWHENFPYEGETHTLQQWAQLVGREVLRKIVVLSNKERFELQKEAEKKNIPIVDGDIDNIRETLPFLLPEQQEDVVKAELQYFSKEHQDEEHCFGTGFLFTNGTGSGKTYTGLGVIKRFVSRSKKRILIVVPSQKKCTDWINCGKNVCLNITNLTDYAKEETKRRGEKVNATETAGSGIVVTTYANFAGNKALLKEDFDLITYDECHNLMANNTATSNKRTKKFYKMAPVSISAGMGRYFARNPKEASINLNGTDEEKEAVRGRAKEYAKGVMHKTKVLFLSATPFNTRRSLEYADGYLFKSGDKFRNFLKQTFPSAKPKMNDKEDEVLNPTQLAEEERSFGDKLQREFQTASGRKVVIPKFDYGRHFNILDFKNAGIINGATRALSKGDYGDIMWKIYHEVFNYNNGNAVFEAWKTALLIPFLKKAIADGAGITFFYRRQSVKNETAVAPPFSRIIDEAEMTITALYHDGYADKAEELREELDRFKEDFGEELVKKEQEMQKENPDCFSLPSVQLQKHFGKDCVRYDGKMTAKAREEAAKLFQADAKSIIAVQISSGKEGIDLHDTHGNRRRILINVAIPFNSLELLQVEGRIFRWGVQSNSVILYPRLGLDAEMELFAEGINRRATTTENLAMGSEARNLAQSFIEDILLNETGFPFGEEAAVGGKERDSAERGNEMTFDAARRHYNNRIKLEKTGASAPIDVVPEPIGWLMSKFAEAEIEDSVLVPDASIGTIARYVDKTGIVVLEGNPQNISMLLLRAKFSKVLQTFVKDYAKQNKHDIILYDLSSKTDKAGMNDLTLAYRDHLKDNGRLVAVIPNNEECKGAFSLFLKNNPDAVLRADIALPNQYIQDNGYRLVVIDRQNNGFLRSKIAKIPVYEKDFSKIIDMRKLFSALSEVDVKAFKRQMDDEFRRVKRVSFVIDRIKKDEEKRKGKSAKKNKDGSVAFEEGAGLYAKNGIEFKTVMTEDGERILQITLYANTNSVHYLSNDMFHIILYNKFIPIRETKDGEKIYEIDYRDDLDILDQIGYTLRRLVVELDFVTGLIETRSEEKLEATEKLSELLDSGIKKDDPEAKKLAKIIAESDKSLKNSEKRLCVIYDMLNLFEAFYGKSAPEFWNYCLSKSDEIDDSIYHRKDWWGDIRKTMETYAKLTLDSEEDVRKSYSKERIAEDLTGYNLVKTLLEKAGITVVESEVKVNGKELKDSTGKTYGWTKEGVIYINKKEFNANTPMHEYAHLWFTFMEKTQPKVIDRLIEILKGGKVWQEVLSNKAYKNIWDNDSAMADEVFARIVGKTSENTDGLREMVAKRTFWKALWEGIKRIFGIGNKVRTDKMYLSDFTNMVMKDLVNKVDVLQHGASMGTRYLSGENETDWSPFWKWSKSKEIKAKLGKVTDKFHGTRYWENKVFNEDSSKSITYEISTYTQNFGSRNPYNTLLDTFRVYFDDGLFLRAEPAYIPTRIGRFNCIEYRKTVGSKHYGIGIGDYNGKRFGIDQPIHKAERAQFIQTMKEKASLIAKIIDNHLKGIKPTYEELEALRFDDIMSFYDYDDSEFKFSDHNKPRNEDDDSDYYYIKKNSIKDNKKGFKLISDLLKRAGIKVVFTDKTIDGRPLKTSNGTIYGYVDNGVIYINKDRLNAETPIHEYAHIWVAALRKARPDVYASLKADLKGTRLLAQVEENEDYSDIWDDEDAMIEECFARMTGWSGSMILEDLDAEEKAKRRNLLSRFWRAVWRFILDCFGVNRSTMVKSFDPRALRSTEIMNMCMADLRNKVRLAKSRNDNATKLLSKRERELYPRRAGDRYLDATQEEQERMIREDFEAISVISKRNPSKTGKTDKDLELLLLDWWGKGQLMLDPYEDKYGKTKYRDEGDIMLCLRIAQRNKMNLSELAEFNGVKDVLSHYKNDSEELVKNLENKRLDPVSLPYISLNTELSGKVGDSFVEVYDIDEGWTEPYKIDLTKAKTAQASVRKLIDEYYGKENNPWCICSRKYDDLGFDNWENNSEYPKQIVFVDRELVAMKAGGNSAMYWDSQDYAHKGVPIVVKGDKKLVPYEDENVRDINKRQLVYGYNPESDNGKDFNKLPVIGVWFGDKQEGKRYYYRNDGPTSGIYLFLNLEQEEEYHEGKKHGIFKTIEFGKTKELKWYIKGKLNLLVTYSGDTTYTTRYAKDGTIREKKESTPTHEERTIFGKNKDYGWYILEKNGIRKRYFFIGEDRKAYELVDEDGGNLILNNPRQNTYYTNEYNGRKVYDIDFTEDGDLKKITKYNKKGREVSVETFRRDKNGELISTKTETGSFETEFGRAKRIYTMYRGQDHFKVEDRIYLKDKKITRIFDVGGLYKTIEEYSDGRVCKKKYYKGILSEIYFYDEEGKKIKEGYFTAWSEDIYKYTEEGVIIESRNTNKGFIRWQRGGVDYSIDWRTDNRGEITGIWSSVDDKKEGLAIYYDQQKQPERIEANKQGELVARIDIQNGSRVYKDRDSKRISKAKFFEILRENNIDYDAVIQKLEKVYNEKNKVRFSITLLANAKKKIVKSMNKYNDFYEIDANIKLDRLEVDKEDGVIIGFFREGDLEYSNVAVYRVKERSVEIMTLDEIRRFDVTTELTEQEKAGIEDMIDRQDDEFLDDLTSARLSSGETSDEAVEADLKADEQKRKEQKDREITYAIKAHIHKFFKSVLRKWRNIRGYVSSAVDDYHSIKKIMDAVGKKENERYGKSGSPVKLGVYGQLVAVDSSIEGKIMLFLGQIYNPLLKLSRKITQKLGFGDDLDIIGEYLMFLHYQERTAMVMVKSFVNYKTREQWIRRASRQIEDKEKREEYVKKETAKLDKEFGEKNKWLKDFKEYANQVSSDTKTMLYFRAVRKMGDKKEFRNDMEKEAYENAVERKYYELLGHKVADEFVEKVMYADKDGVGMQGFAGENDMCSTTLYKLMVKEYHKGVPLDKAHIKPLDIAADFEKYTKEKIGEDLLFDVGSYVQHIRSLVLSLAERRGYISSDRLKELSAFQYYVPLKGWRKKTPQEERAKIARQEEAREKGELVEDEDEVIGEPDTYQDIQQHAEGRYTTADNPLKYLLGMVITEIRATAYVEAKERLVRYLYENRDVAYGEGTMCYYTWKERSVNESGEFCWVERMGNEAPDEFDPIVKPGSVRFVVEGKKFKNFTRKDLKEHCIEAMVDGKLMRVYVADKAVVKRLVGRSKPSDNVFMKLWRLVPRFTRFLASSRTTKSPSFFSANLVRDIGSALILDEVSRTPQERAKYIKEFFKTLVQCRAVVRGVFNENAFAEDWEDLQSLANKLLDGAEDFRLKGDFITATALEQQARDLLYNEDLVAEYVEDLKDKKMLYRMWLSNGGMSGYGFHLKNLNEEFQRRYEKLTRGAVRKGVAVINPLELSWFTKLAETSENMVRFASFCANLACDPNLSLQEATYRSKEATINFSRSGWFTRGIGQVCPFFNASVQSLMKILRSGQYNPKHTAKGFSIMGGLGALAMSYIVWCLSQAGGGDDDKWEKYFSVTEYTRMHNIIIGKVKIPIPQEFYGIFAVGFCAAKRAFGLSTDNEMAYAIISSACQLLPSEFEGGINSLCEYDEIRDKLRIKDQGLWGTACGMIPGVLEPIAQYLNNRDYAERPILPKEWLKGEIPQAGRFDKSKTRGTFQELAFVYNNLSSQFQFGKPISWNKDEYEKLVEGDILNTHESDGQPDKMKTISPYMLQFYCAQYFPALENFFGKISDVAFGRKELSPTALPITERFSTYENKHGLLFEKLNTIYEIRDRAPKSRDMADNPDKYDKYRRSPEYRVFLRFLENRRTITETNKRIRALKVGGAVKNRAEIDRLYNALERFVDENILQDYPIRKVKKQD